MIILLLLLYCCSTIYYKKYTTYIDRSSINGEGLFANTRFKKNDIILENIFPHKPSNIKLYNPISKYSFDRYISVEGTKINHCNNDTNSDVITDDYKTYRLVATKFIENGDEIKCNYDIIHKKYPFIASSKPFFKKC